ncbi:MAG TPA: sensor histidine kinase [Chloroflexota bacterium]|nr:sensor histidine kinase [Chloroflexota bacterium]
MSERPLRFADSLSRVGADGGPRSRVRNAAALIWLLFVLIPLMNALGNGGPTVRKGFALAGAVVFVAAYVALVLISRRGYDARIAYALFALLVAIAAALTLGERPGWAFLFTYCAACGAFVVSSELALTSVISCTVLAGMTSAAAGANRSTVIGSVASAAGIGLLMMLMRDLRMRNQELSAARAELARLAVAEERQRFARDLHDLLGHSLSVIALKAELAGRLLPERAGEAREEVGAVEAVARQALTEVREAVSGYRQPTLEGELAGARMALSAAGIEAEVVRDPVSLDPTVEAVLAWAVREGATNVIRHSRARHVSVRAGASVSEAFVEVVDDGLGGSVNGQGHGLAGLGERVRALNGSVQAAARVSGGFTLAVTVPTDGP